MVVVKSFTTPLVWVLVLLVLSLILTRPGRRKRLFAVGRWSLLLGTVLLFAFSLNPVANVLAYPLESQYEFPPAFVGANDDSPTGYRRSCSGTTRRVHCGPRRS
jgi:hypothetical protein